MKARTLMAVAGVVALIATVPGSSDREDPGGCVILEQRVISRGR